MGSEQDPPGGGQPDETSEPPERPWVAPPSDGTPRHRAEGPVPTPGPEAPEARPEQPMPQPEQTTPRHRAEGPIPAPGPHAPPPERGGMRFQDAATTRPRPPTVGEARAREKALRKQEEIEEARLAAEAKRRKRNRRLIGGAAVVGVVGVVAALGYWALKPRHVTAQCVQEDPSGQPVIVADSYCTGHSPGVGGFFFFGGHQYRYYYGSSGSVGSRPVGGTTVAPSGATITTKSGTTVQRGGLGSKFGGSGS